MSLPICIDLFCGLGGWSEGFLAEGYQCFGFDIERHDYGQGGYPGDLVLQDILTLDGAQFRDAAIIVASPPCQEYSYMAMPWSRGKQIAHCLRDGDNEFPEGYNGSRTLPELKALFYACIRIQIEASHAARRYIPIVIENVRGAQPWVGKANAAYGSFLLWGDIAQVGNKIVRPDLKGEWLKAPRRQVKVGGFSWSDFGKPDYWPEGFNVKVAREFRDGATKLSMPGDDSLRIGFQQNAAMKYRELSPAWRAKHYDDTEKAALAAGPNGVKFGGKHGVASNWGRTAVENKADSEVESAGPPSGTKHGGDCFSDPTWAGRIGGSTKGAGDGWFNDAKRKGGTETGYLSRSGSKSDSRKAASAQIAKIPLPLSRHIARIYKP